MEELKITIEEETVHSYLIELSKKHNCDVNMLMVGMSYGDMHIWKYDEGALNVFQRLEIVNFFNK